MFCFFSQAIAFIRHSLMYVLPSVPHTVFITGRQSFFLGHTQVRDPSGALWQTAYIGHFRRRQPPTGESGRKFNQQITFQVLIDLKRLTGSYTFSERFSRLFQINWQLNTRHVFWIRGIAARDQTRAAQQDASAGHQTYHTGLCFLRPMHHQRNRTWPWDDIR